MRRRVRVGLAAAVLALTASVAVVTVGPLAIDVCLTSYELGGQSGDRFTICSTTPGNVKVANLTTRTDNLVNGCQRIVNQSSTWNDCITSARVENLGSNYRVRWYLDINYSNVGYCTDVNGTSSPPNFGGVGAERISSFRVEGGNC